MSATKAHFGESMDRIQADITQLKQEVHELRQEFHDRKNGSKWSVWIQIVVSALLTLFLAIALPWMKWVTSSINNLEAHDVKMEQWKENRATVLALNKEETLKEVREIVSKEIGQLSGQIQTLQKQSVENGYDIRRLQEMLLQHLQEGRSPKTSAILPYNPWVGILRTNLYNVPGSSQQVGDDYALIH